MFDQSNAMEAYGSITYRSQEYKLHMFSFDELLAIHVLDSFMLPPIPRLKNAELLILCDVMRYCCA